MRFINKILIWMLPALLLSVPAFGHHLWVSIDDGGYAVNRGIISKRTDAYDPACVREVKACGQDGEPLSVQRINDPEQVRFQTGAPAAMASVVSKWGDRVNTTRGKKLMSRSEAEKAGLNVISAFFSTQYSKALFKHSDQNLKPTGMKFEIVPLDNPLVTGPGEEIVFRVLFENKPLENSAVYTQDDREFKTDKNGMVRIAFEENGLHLLYAKHKTPDESDRGFDYLKFMTFLTFEVKK